MQNILSYNDAIKLLTSQGKFKINLGLERISAILELLGNPQDKLKCIHVAGTNGKGSVCAILAEILKEARFKTGLYTSPHIFEYTERIKINGDEIPQETFAKLVSEIIELANANNIDLTEFEILTAVMFKYFADENIDYAILETGLGGRFDATNVIKSNLCAIITHIDLDHTERLGNTRSKIAFEKAGIIKPNCPVITSEGYEEIKDAADKNNSLFLLVTPFSDTQDLSLKGTYQAENLALALNCIQLLFPQIPQSTVKKALGKVQHPCRFEFHPDANLIIDGAHNPNGALALRESLDTYFPSEPRRFIFGVLRNKDYEKMMNTLFTPNDEIYFYHFNNPNSMPAEELACICPYPSKPYTGKEITPDKLNIICGSFYMIKELINERHYIR